MSDEHRVGTVDDFAEGGIHPVELDGEEIVVVRVGDEVFACAAICSHAHAYFDQGRVEGYELFCPFHAGRFDLRTGEATHRPAREPISTYPVRIEDCQVVISTSRSDQVI